MEQESPSPPPSAASAMTPSADLLVGTSRASSSSSPPPASQPSRSSAAAAAAPLGGPSSLFTPAAAAAAALATDRARGGAVAGAASAAAAAASSATRRFGAVASPRATERPLFDLASLEEALEAAERCGAAEKEGLLGDCANNPWEQAARLRPILTLVAQPEFVPPPRFQQSMSACMACLLHAPQGCLKFPGRMVELLDSPDAEPLLKYLEWLEAALRAVSPGLCGSSCRTVLVPQRVRSALSSWAAERALLQQSASALLEALRAHAPDFESRHAVLRRALEERQQIQQEQEEECRSISRDLENAAAELAENLRQATAMAKEWTQLARLSETSLTRIQQLAADFLQNQEACWGPALEDFEAFGARAAAAKAAALAARRQVRRHAQDFSQAAQRFAEVASQLVAWTSALVPKLRLLGAHRDELRGVAELRRRVPLLAREHLAAEDDLDAAQTELRKHRRHAQAAKMKRQVRSTDSVGMTAAAVLERQYELRVTHAEERVVALAEQLREAECQLRGAEAALPLELDMEEEEQEEQEEDGETASPDSPPKPKKSPGQVLTSEERLALKLASLEQFHEEVAMQVSEFHTERDRVLRQVSERKSEEALRRRVEPDFMCPITHERMREPVLAADGHTYERQAIERWLQLHNTSPMTGSPLAHRYLTENFALRNFMNSYEDGQDTDQQERPPDIASPNGTGGDGLAAGRPPGRQTAAAAGADDAGLETEAAEEEALNWA